MSRWIDTFKSHRFQQSWLALKKNLENTVVDDESVISSVQELARLNKVVTYLDSLISSLDPELIPLTIWDSFFDQLNQCLAQVSAYNKNRNVGHITNANNHADNLLAYIRPYMVVASAAAKAMQSSLKSYHAVIDGFGESFISKGRETLGQISALKDKSEEYTDFTNSVKLEIEALEKKLFNSDESDLGLEGKIDKVYGQINNIHSQIDDYHNEIFGGEGNLSIKKSVEQAKDSVDKDKLLITELLENAQDDLSELSKFHKKIFGVTVSSMTDDDEESVVKEGGLEQEIDERVKELSLFEEFQKTRYKALNDQIEALMPGATSAGLATAYKEMKDSFNAPILYSTIAFGVSMLFLLVSAFWTTVESAGVWYINFVSFDNWSDVFLGVIKRIPVYGPVVWVAIFATSRRSESQRLQQEYAHKEALAKSYDGYKKQLSDLGNIDEDMQKAFILMTIDAITYNASATLDGKHSDEGPSQKILEKLFEMLPKSS